MLPKYTRVAADWLAVGNVQLLVSENPHIITKGTEEPSTLKQLMGQPSTSALPTQSTMKIPEKLGSCQTCAKRAAVLASLKNEIGLQGLPPYLV